MAQSFMIDGASGEEGGEGCGFAWQTHSKKNNGNKSQVVTATGNVNECGLAPGVQTHKKPLLELSKRLSHPPPRPRVS